MGSNYIDTIAHNKFIEHPVVKNILDELTTKLEDLVAKYATKLERTDIPKELNCDTLGMFELLGYSMWIASDTNDWLDLGNYVDLADLYPELFEVIWNDASMAEEMEQEIYSTAKDYGHKLNTAFETFYGLSLRFTYQDSNFIDRDSEVANLLLHISEVYEKTEGAKLFEKEVGDTIHRAFYTTFE